MHTQVKPSLTWYRQFWPWFLLSIPLASIILSSIMIALAVTGQDSLVSDNYYKDGLAINQELMADKQAKALGIRAIASLSNPDYLKVELSSDSALSVPALTLKLLHTTMQGQDQKVQLFPLPGGGFGNTLEKPLAIGKWHAHLLSHDGSWRIKGFIELPGSHEIMLAPQT